MVVEWETTVYVPPGWPRVVLPPGVDGWEQTAVAFLLDCCPPDYRSHSVLRRHAVVLAEFARYHVASQVRASAEGVATIRAELSGRVPDRVIQEAVEAWQQEAATLHRTRRAVDLVRQALSGEGFVQKL